MNRRIQAAASIGALGLAGALGYTLRARASGIPTTNTLSYAGVLEDANGPVTGSHNVQVLLYDAASAGNVLCQTTSTAVNVVNGHFSLPLPASCTPKIGATCSAGTCTGGDANAWVDVLVDGSDVGRVQIGAVPYSVESNHAINADTATHANTAASATTATNATHASSADTATNATNATSAQTAAGAGYVVAKSGNQISFDWTGQLEMYVDATQIKTFVIDHPTDPERYLVHATLEGPESAVYYRGTARLHHGTTEVSLPSYFESETKLDGRTALVTPVFETASEPVSNLAVSSIRGGKFAVRGIDAANPDQPFSWEVKAVRADVPALAPEPRREDVSLHGDGPYRYLTPRLQSRAGE